MTITALYMGLAALLLIAFSVQVIRCRVKHRVVLLDGGVDVVARHCRAHANFTEYAPMVLLLITISEMNGASSLLLNAMGVAFLIGRISHFYSLTVREVAAAKQGKMDLRFRQFGMMLTFTTLGVGAINALLIAL
jgi:uncharacterized protein